MATFSLYDGIAQDSSAHSHVVHLLDERITDYSFPTENRVNEIQRGESFLPSDSQDRLWIVGEWTIISVVATPAT